MSSAVTQVVIVGGGTAGWLTAAVLASAHDASSGMTFTLLESPQLAPIGVGEGTWPSIRDTLRAAGLSETAFVRECDASFKQGSKFERWVTGADDDYYFHPFALPHGYLETDLVAGWMERADSVRFADLVSAQPHVCMRGRAPKQFATPEFAAVANYAYHLDATKFALFLRKHCVERLGVRHVLDHMVGVESAENEDIAGVRTREHGVLNGDLFIDCTGMQSLLLGEHFGVKFLPQQHVLFNDRALAMPVAYASEEEPIASATISSAQSTGWIWDIGLPTRRGVGYVYSSAHSDDDLAERELRTYVERTGGKPVAAARKISFQPGYREKFWHRNCVAIGLSAGFIEPLEASAIALIEFSAVMLRDQMPATRDAMDLVGRRFNDAFTYRWERVIEFLKLHYVLSRRGDSHYWRDHREPESIPSRLQELLAFWQQRAPSRYDFPRIEEIFPSASYQYVLYGMGFRPQTAARSRAHAHRAEHYFRESATLANRLLAGLPSNRELIAHIRRVGLPGT